MQRVVISWFVSPAVSSVLCAILICLVSLTTLNGAGAGLKWRLFNLQIVSGFSFAIVLYMVLILVQKNYTAADEPIIDTWQYGLFPAAFVIGWLSARFFMGHLCMPKGTFGTKLAFAFKICSFAEVVTFTESQDSDTKRVDF
jgi:hypothetical protein